jgi:hypothetical protein
MRPALGIVIVLCLGLPAAGAASQQQEPSAGNSVGQNPAPSSPPSEPRAQPKTEPKTEPTKEPEAGSPTEPRTEPRTEPPTAPSTAPSSATQSEHPTEPGTEHSAQPAAMAPTIEPHDGEPTAEPTHQTNAASSGATPKSHAVGKHVRSTAPDGKPRKVVVREGGADEPTAQIVTGMAPEEANRQRQRAEELLKSTDETLRRTDPLTLNARQQETVSQIHNYMEGARAALKEGDLSRARTLAVKAGLLADDLTRH